MLRKQTCTRPQPYPWDLPTQQAADKLISDQAVTMPGWRSVAIPRAQWEPAGLFPQPGGQSVSRRRGTLTNIMKHSSVHARGNSMCKGTEARHVDAVAVTMLRKHRGEGRVRPARPACSDQTVGLMTGRRRRQRQGPPGDNCRTPAGNNEGGRSGLSDGVSRGAGLCWAEEGGFWRPSPQHFPISSEKTDTTCRGFPRALRLTSAPTSHRQGPG